MRNLVLLQQLKQLETLLNRADFNAIRNDVAVLIKVITSEDNESFLNQKINGLVGVLRKNLFSLLSNNNFYPSPRYNALHNGLLLLAHHYPHPGSIDDNGVLQCAIEWTELKPTDKYFITAEGLHYSQKAMKEWFFKKKDYKNPFTQLDFTTRDKDRIELFCTQNDNHFELLGRGFKVTFSKANVLTCIVWMAMILFFINVMSIIIWMIANLILTEKNILKPEWVIELCTLTPYKLVVATVLGGFRFTISDSISTIKSRIGTCYENLEIKSAAEDNRFFKSKIFNSIPTSLPKLSPGN